MMAQTCLSLWLLTPLLLLYSFVISNSITSIFIDPVSPEARIPQGTLQGRWFLTRDGRRVAGFLSIPYAAAPVGPLRFKDPQPPPKWEGVYSATKEAPGCIQKVGGTRTPIYPTVVSEDCLYLNVFSPKVTSANKLPVIVFFYGGGFERVSGNSSAYGPDYLLDEDVILVTFNYRGGILGFLSLEHPVQPGNIGLKDQRAVLRWVNKNIQHFGGDPDRVTLYGYSAGAVSVELQRIFTAKEGLFRAVISSSGSSLSLFGVQSSYTQRPLVDKLAEITKCPRHPERLLDCLRKIPASDFENIRQEVGKTSLDIKSHSPVFNPVVEPCCVDDPLITGDPWMATTSIPLLQGGNQFEGLVRTVEYETDKTDRKLRELNENYKSVLPYNLFFSETTDYPTKVAERLRGFYFGKNEIDRDHYIDLVNLVSDALYNYGLVRTARSNLAKTYFYQFNYKGSNTYVHYLGSSAYYGVSHTDDIFFTFPFGGPTERNITVHDTIVSKTFVKLLTNFATNLDPTPNGYPIKWTPVETPSIEYLNIMQDQILMQRGFLKQRMDFWDSLPFKTKVLTSWPCHRWNDVLR